MDDAGIEPTEPPLIRRGNLRDLLTAKMDDLPIELERMGRIVGADSDRLLRNVFCYEAFSENRHAVKMLEAMDVVFHTKPETGLNYLTGSKVALAEFSVALDIVNGSLPEMLKNKIQNSDKAFNLTELYNKHKDYILYLYWKKPCIH